MNLRILPTSYIYYTLVDYNDRPKIALSALMSGVYTMLYCNGYGLVGSLVYTFIFFELVMRVLGIVLFVLFL